MEVFVYPTYEEVFPGEPIPVFEELIKQLPVFKSIQVYAFLNSTMHLNSFDLESQEDTLRMWLRGMDKDKAAISYAGYLNFKSRILKTNPPGKIIIFNPLTLLELIDDLLVGNSCSISSISDKDFEFLLYKVYLLKNQNNNLRNVASKVEFNKIYEFQITQIASQYEFTHRKNILPQLIMAKDFFEFVSNDNEFKDYYNFFLKGKGISSYPQYLRQITLIYTNFLKHPVHNNFRIEGADFVSSFFNGLSHELPTSFEVLGNGDLDFKRLREKPLLKISNDSYCPLHLNFFIDKIYYGMIWDFYYSSSINKVFNKFQDYLQKLGLIIEKEIFYKYINDCFPSRFIKKVNGSQYPSVEYSDFYIRDGKRLFLFEFKNCIVKSDIKYSHNFNNILKEIKSKLYFDSKSKKDKGIRQLKKVLSRIINKEIFFDKYDDSILSKLEVYPIIVYTDPFFSIDGINYLVNTLFRSEIEADPKLVDLKVNDLIMISMESLFDIISLIDQKDYSFRKVCDYFLHKKMKDEKRSKRPTHEDHIKKMHRGLDRVMAPLLKSVKPSDKMLDILASALKD